MTIGSEVGFSLCGSLLALSACTMRLLLGAPCTLNATRAPIYRLTACNELILYRPMTAFAVIAYVLLLSEPQFLAT